MDDSNSSKNTNGNKSIKSSSSTDCEMDMASENIDQKVLQETGEQTMSADWSVTSSALNSLDTSSSNSCINIETLKKCASPSDTLNDKADFLVLECTNVNISKFNADETKYPSTFKTTRFKKKTFSSNVSQAFENILDNESQMEVDISIKSPKFRVSKKNKYQPCNDISDYNLSTESFNNVSNVSQVKQKFAFKKPELSFPKNDDSNVMEVSKSEVSSQKFTRKRINIVDSTISAFDNIINDISTTSDIDKKSLTSTSVINDNGISICDSMEVPSLNHTYDIPLYSNSTQIGLVTDSIENNTQLNNISAVQLIDETYTIKNNLNETFTLAQPGLKLSNKTVTTLSDMSNIINQSKFSVKKSNLNRKSQLEDVSQDCTFTIIKDDNSSKYVHEDINATENKSKRFKLNNSLDNTNSKVVENMTSSQENDGENMSLSINTNKLNNIIPTKTLVEISNDNDLSNLSKSKESVVESNVLINEIVQNSTINDETSNIDNKKFKRDKPFNNADSKIFENIITTQEIEISASKTSNIKNDTIPNSSNASIKADLYNISKSEQNFKSIDKINVVLNNIENSSVSDETEDIKSKRFKLDKQVNDADSKIFDNIITNSQESEMSITKNDDMSNGTIFNKLITQTGTSSNNQSLNISNSQQNMTESVDKSLSQQSNVLLEAIAQNSTINNEINVKENAKLNRFGLKKMVVDADSIIFDNIITSSQENENMSISQNKTLFNTSNSQQNITESIDKLSSQQSNVLLNAVTENSTVNDETKEVENVESNRFVLKKIDLDINSKIFENIITNSQESEMATSKNTNASNSTIPNSLDDQAVNSSNKKLLNIQNSQQNKTELSIKTLSQESNILLSTVDENEPKTSLLYENNKSSNFSRRSSKLFGCDSQSDQEDSLKNISINSLSPMLESENIFTNSLGSQQFNISVPSIHSQEAEESSHKLTKMNLELTQNTTFKPSQSPGTHFTDKRCVNAHSGVFSGLINDSLNSNTSLNVSKQVKFKNHKNTSQAHSIIFENVISNSQESNNITLTQNKTVSHSVLMDQDDEISVFANTLELASACKSLRSLNRSLNKVNTVQKLNLEKSESETSVNNISNGSSVLQSEEPMNYDCSLSHISSLSMSTSQNDVSNKTFGVNQSIVTDDANLSNESTCSFKTNIPSDNEELTLFNSTIASIESSASQKNQSKRSSTSRYSTSVSSNNDDSVKSSTPSKNQSKRSKTSNASSNSLIIEEDTSIVNISTHSSKQEKNLNQTNVIDENPENEELLNVTVDFQEQNELSLNQSKKSISKHNFQNASNNLSSVSYKLPGDNTNNISTTFTCSSEREKLSHSNVDLALLNVIDEKLEDKVLLITTAGLLKQNEPTLNNSRNASYTSNKSLIGDNTNNVSRMSTCSVKLKEQPFSSVEPNTSNVIGELSKIEDFSNITAGSLEQKESSTNKLKRSISTLFSPTQPESNSLNISTRSSKQKKQYHGNVDLGFSNVVDEQQESERLSCIIGSLKQNEFSLNQSEGSTSKHHLQNNSKNVSNLSNHSLIQKENTCNVSVISTHSLKQEKQCFDNTVQEQSNSIDKLSNNEDSSIIAATSLELKESSINQSKRSNSKYNKQNGSSEIAITCNSFIPEDDVNNVRRISTRSFKQKSYSLQNKEPAIAELKQNKSFSTRVTRSSSVSGNIQKSISNKTLTNNKSLVSESNVNHLSTRSSRSSKRMAESNIESVDNSIFWTTVSENSTSKTTLENDVNKLFETPKSNKSTITKHEKTAISNKTLTNNKSLVSENNVNHLSTRSTRSSKCLSSNVENVDDSILWTTLSENSTSKTTLENDVNKLFETPKTNKSTITEHEKTEISNKTLTNNKSLISENNVNQVSTRSTRSSKRLSSNVENVDDSILWTTLSENSTNKTTLENDVIKLFETPKTNKSTITEHEKTEISNKTLTNNKSLVSENNVNRISTRSTRSSNHLAEINTKNNIVKIADSVLKTTLSKDPTSKSIMQNNVNELFETPKNNKLTIAENIIRTIGIMSVKKQKATHPGVFELEDSIRRQSNRPFMKRFSNEHSPSILTRVLAGNKTFETITPLQSLSETVIDQSQIPENIKEKFKVLYNKESWITKRLYNFLTIKLQPKYNIYSVKYAEKFIKYLASILKQVLNNKVDLQLYTDMLMYHMARYGIVETTFDYLQFLSDFIPNPYYKKLVPGWNLETSNVKFNPLKYYVPIMEDEEFLTKVLENLNASE